MEWDYVGNEWAVNMLRQQVVHGSTRHAYILAGPDGLGKRTLAIKFIQSLNCTKAEGNGNPCLECRSCRQIEAMQYSDLQVIEKLEDKSEIRKEQVDEVNRFLSLSPYESKLKASILIDFQTASTEAQNALLKTLEEAPGNSMIIITVDSVDNLLPTTVSRCEVLSLRPLPAREIAFVLVSRLNVEGHLAELLGHISGGRYGYARLLAEDPELLEQRSTWLDEWVELFGMTRVQRFKYIENKLSRRGDLKKQREMLVGMIECWASFVRDVLLAANTAGTGPMNIDRKEDITRLTARLGSNNCVRIIRSLEQASNRIDRYYNPRLTMEMLMLEIGRDSD
jgi:DNA polymerase III subunit delta'